MFVTKRVVLTAAVVSLGYSVFRFLPAIRYWMSRALENTGESYSINVSNLRSRFMDEQMIPLHEVIAHTHGASAKDRSTGSYFIQQYGRTLNRNVWYYQCSLSDQRNRRLGSRSFYWVKDLTAAPAVYSPQGGDLVAMVDVDQYIDMPNFLSEQFRPTILYTFQPGHVARDTGEYNYTFVKDGGVEYRVSGGAVYRHHVWSYNDDSYKIVRTVLGLPYSVTTYLCDKRGTDDDHQIILLSPLKRWWGLSALLAIFLEGPQLLRLNPVEGQFTRMIRVNKTGVTTCTGLVGKHIAGAVPSKIDDYFASLVRTSKFGLTLPSVKALMPDDPCGAAIIYEYHLNKAVSSVKIETVSPADFYVRGYQFSPEDYDSSAKPIMCSFMPPIIDGAFVPVEGINNARQAVKGRILAARSTTTLDKFMIECVEEFVTLFLGADRGTLVPCGTDEVYEKQNKPSQRRILGVSEFEGVKRILKNFLKKESYQKCTDPRIISTINGRDKADYSRFMYPFTNLLKKQAWYAFGKTPLEISYRVVRVCENAMRVSNTDYERMDGHISEVFRHLEKRLFVSAFHPDFTEEILESMRSQFSLRGYVQVKSGEVETYDQKLARASGSPETANFNSIDAAFNAYLAFRMTRKPNGMFYNAEEAYSELGIYGGDDGLTADISPRIYKKAATLCGQILEVEPVLRHTFGVKFLSRVYGPEVWSGDINSCTDVPRALSKFHVTTHMPTNISQIDKLLDKAYAYYLTDANSPVIGPFVTKVIKFSGLYKFKNICNNWNAQYDASVQYPNEVGDWAEDYVFNAMPDFPHGPYYETLEKCLSLAEMMNGCLTFSRPAVKSKSPVVVDGDIYIPPILPLADSFSPETKSMIRPRPKEKRTPSRTGTRRQPTKARVP